MSIKTFQPAEHLQLESELNISLGDLSSNQGMTGALCEGTIAALDDMCELMSQQEDRHESSTVDVGARDSQQSSEQISADQLEALISEPASEAMQVDHPSTEELVLPSELDFENSQSLLPSQISLAEEPEVMHPRFGRLVNFYDEELLVQVWDEFGI